MVHGGYPALERMRWSFRLDPDVIIMVVKSAGLLI